MGFFYIFILVLDYYMYNNFLTYTFKPEKIELHKLLFIRNRSYLMESSLILICLLFGNSFYSDFWEVLKQSSKLKTKEFHISWSSMYTPRSVTRSEAILDLSSRFCFLCLCQSLERLQLKVFHFKLNCRFSNLYIFVFWRKCVHCKHFAVISKQIFF